MKEGEGAGHVARMGEMRNTAFVSESLEGSEHLGDIGIDGRRIILQWILKK
jgi:hypothetical protein